MHGKIPLPAIAPPSSFAFAPGDHIVYPGNGVGRIESISIEAVGGVILEMVNVSFSDTRMRLMVPLARAERNGMRALSTAAQLEDAKQLLNGKPRINKALWSRRSREYETKIASCDLMVLAEIVRDLGRNRGNESEISTSERYVYERALERFAGEWAAIEGLDARTVAEGIQATLQAKPARSRRGAATEEVADSEEPDV